MSQIKIAIASRKGGVGKTTLTVAIASILAHRGKRVLIVDCDPQSNAAFFIGADSSAAGTAELLLGEAAEPLATDQERLFVLPGGLRLQDHAVARLDPSDLADELERFADFDAVIFDCPPGHENLERLAMRGADVAILPANAHPAAFLGVNQVLADIELARERKRPAPSRVAIVLCQLDRRRALDKTVEDAAADSWPDFARFAVRQDSRLAQITADRAPLMKQPSSQRGPALPDLEAIADWCEGKGKTK